MNIYQCFHGNDRTIVYAKSPLEAREIAADRFKVKTRRWLVHAILIAVGDKVVKHSTSEV